MRTDETASFQEHLGALRGTSLRVFLLIASGTILSFFFYSSIISVLTSPLNKINSDKVASSLLEERLEHVYLKNNLDKAQIYRLPSNFVDIVKISPKVEMLEGNSVSLPPNASLTYSQSIKTAQLFVLGPLEGMLIALKTSLWVGAIVTSPFWLFIIFQFIFPALHQHEKRLIFPFVIISLILMVIGGLFAFRITIPLANDYLSSFNQAIGINLWSLEHYLNYTFFLVFANSLAFESFVIGIFAVHLGIVSGEALKSHRRLAIVCAFVAGAVLTPPDVFTQLMLAIPLVILYEIVVLYARLKKV